MRAKSEGELLHTVKGFLQMIQSNGTGNAEAVCAGAAEHAAGRDHDVCPLQQGLAEFRVAQPCFLDSGEQVEGTLGAYQAEIGNFFDAVRRVKNAVPIGGYIILADVLTNRQRLDGCHSQPSLPEK